MEKNVGISFLKLKTFEKKSDSNPKDLVLWVSITFLFFVKIGCGLFFRNQRSQIFEKNYFLQKVLEKKSRSDNLVISQWNYVIFGALQNYTKKNSICNKWQ